MDRFRRNTKGSAGQPSPSRRVRVALTERGFLSTLVLIFLAISISLPLSSTRAIAQDDTTTSEAVIVDIATKEPAPAEEPPIEQPAAEQPTDEAASQEPEQEAPPLETGMLEIRLMGSTGTPLSGLFVVYDAAGNEHQGWTNSGVAWFDDLTAGTATVYQAAGTTDFAFSASEPSYIDIPAAGQAVLPVINTFLDADGDSIGDSVDICAAGDDAIDTDGDAIPDACDETPLGDPTEAPPPTEELAPTEDPAVEKVNEVARVAALPPCAPTAGVAGGTVNFGSLVWSGNGYPTGAGSLAVEIGSTGTSCSGFPTKWSVQVRTGAMNRSGGGGTIPAEAISYTGTATGTAPSGLTPANGTSFGTNAQTIATGNATTSTGKWQVGLALTPPAATAPGTYTGTITVTIASGS